MAAPLIIAHRGASYDAPENTLAAYRLAWEQQADGAEGDFQLTRDGRIVCIHDRTTGRTANADLVVADTNLAELQGLDVGVAKGARFAGERMATLEEILHKLPPEKLFYIEIKCGAEILLPLRQVVASCGAGPGQLRILCFDADLIAQARRVLPDVKAHWLVDYQADAIAGVKSPSHEGIWRTLGRINADGLNSQADASMLTPDFVRQLRAADLEVAAWTVDDPILAKQLIQAGVEALTTNRPGRLLEQLRS